ncbi:hypothetical protein [Streptomyces scabiei]|uniref:hypothetical protein n=1 Tax=Streptomyces scabiei TaxID=1930 RepID=UPI0029B2D001|nr:hypothetical protein [Streptomyces scabiei]MDX3523175.1 hypothetical protein [Streptomyces scabiei]
MLDANVRILNVLTPTGEAGPVTAAADPDPCPTEPAGPVHTGETVSDGYHQALTAHQAAWLERHVAPAIAEAIESLTRALREQSRRAFPEPDPVEIAQAERRRDAKSAGLRGPFAGGSRSRRLGSSPGTRFTAVGCRKIFADKKSGKTDLRPEQAVDGSGRHREHDWVLVEELRGQGSLARCALLDARADQRGRGPHVRGRVDSPSAGVGRLEVLVGPAPGPPAQSAEMRGPACASPPPNS